MTFLLVSFFAEVLLRTAVQACYSYSHANWPRPLLRGVPTLCMQFMADAQDVMAMLVKVQSEQGEMEPDDPQVTMATMPWRGGLMDHINSCLCN